MACFHPVTGWRSKDVNPDTGKRSVVFSAQRGYLDLPVTIACGQCIGCRLERSRQWAVRCVHEASLYDSNSFITLTYDNDHLPANGSLDKLAFPLFMKRLRKRYGSGIRFFHCGEYGERLRRPHHHAILFNFDFPDKVLWTNKMGNQLYVSADLVELWPFGFSTIGAVTFESAAYVARYVLKKRTGHGAVQHYTEVDPSTGEVLRELNPEFTTMSRRPGIGRPWLDRFKTDVYPSDFVVLNNKKFKPPKYYDNVFQLEDPEIFSSVQTARKQLAEKNSHNNTYERLAVREEIQERKVGQLIRGYENAY